MKIQTECKNLAWYGAYCAAMLEADADKVLEGVEAARRAIQNRAKELESANCSESRELDRAMHFLNLLLHCTEAAAGGLSGVVPPQIFAPMARRASAGR